MITNSLISVVLLIAALATNGAGPAATSGLNSQDRRPVPSVPATDSTTAVIIVTGDTGEELREEFHQTYPLSPTGRISLENINGGVQIKVWDQASVQVDAIKKAHRQGRLNEAKIVVNATEENIKIKTEYPDENMIIRSDERRYGENPATVDFTLTVPRKAVLESIEMVNGSIDIDGVEGRVKATSINGRLNARGLVNEVRLSTINGPLTATFTQLDETKPLQLSSVNGNLTLVIPSNANASVRAGTVHGAITSDFGLKVKHGEYVGHSMEGQIGTGGPRIKLDNVNGGIKITHAEDGLPLSPGVSLQGEAATREERAIEDDVSDGVQAAEAAHAARARIESARVAREAQREAQKQVDQALRESQREIEAAQRQVERERTRIEVRTKVIGKGSGGQNSERVTAKETRTFSVGNAPRVTLSTFDGQVTVHGWDKNEVTYTAVKGAADEETLKQISIQAQQQGDGVSITTVNPEDVNGRVSFDVYVPRQSTLHVSSGDGALNLDGVTGQITLRSGDGPIEVANGGGTLQLNTGDGMIRVIKFEGQVDARTGDGSIALDGNFNALSARTGDGEITLTVPGGSSFTIETNSMEDLANEGFVINEDVTPSPRVKRWKIGNGGKVFILRTGDGKILLRPRQ
ncbi:MAG TPA: DUF4097 family beta strand repeat-containing protein [Pyrinomonadaceae bacterium]|nr:DUF4097 family beta strand repeat-containing protein [Pyrinomonadaceae bacterium]